MAITPEQCRAARALLDISQADMADMASISLSTLRNFEAGRSTPMANNLTALEEAIKRSGVILLAKNDLIDGGAGVRLS